MREKRSLCVEAGLEKVAPFSELPGENSNVPPYKGMGVGGSAQKAPISVISETQEWQSTAADKQLYCLSATPCSGTRGWGHHKGLGPETNLSTQLGVEE